MLDYIAKALGEAFANLRNNTQANIHSVKMQNKRGGKSWLASKSTKNISNEAMRSIFEDQTETTTKQLNSKYNAAAIAKRFVYSRLY